MQNTELSLEQIQWLVDHMPAFKDMLKWPTHEIASKAAKMSQEAMWEKIDPQAI